MDYTSEHIGTYLTMPMPEWFEDESFWTELYPFLFGAEKFEIADKQVEQAVQLAAPGGDLALDLCCGPGRHAVALARRGFRVTAVDRSRYLLAKAEERARDAGVQIELVQRDMREFLQPDAFDLVINLFTSFGYFEDKAQDLGVLRNVHRSLKPGGVLVLEMGSRERLAKIFQPTISTQGADGSLLVQRHEIADDWTRIKNEWILIKDRVARSFEFHLRIYSGQELKDLLAAAGFADVKLYGDLDGRPYGLELERLVAVARREPEP